MPETLTAQQWAQALATKDENLIKQAAEVLAAEAMRNRDRTQMCFLRWGGSPEHATFYAPDTKARVPGHVYSRDGMAELRISKSCEWCFDHAFDEDLSDPDKENKGESL